MQKKSDREHVTPFIYDLKNKFILINVENEENISHIRYTVDKIQDLKLVKEIIKNIQTRPIYIQDIVKLYKKNPKIFEIDKNVKHDDYSRISKSSQVESAHNSSSTHLLYATLQLQQ